MPSLSPLSEFTQTTTQSQNHSAGAEDSEPLTHAWEGLPTLSIQTEGDHTGKMTASLCLFFLRFFNIPARGGKEARAPALLGLAISQARRIEHGL